MFERFTDQARRVVVLAQEEARDLGHNYIGTEHILLGLLREGETLAARSLDALEVTLDTARQRVLEITGRGEGQPSGHIPFTPRTKKVLELSLREALQLGDNHIGTEHLLLGLVREGDGVGAQVLKRLGAPPDQVRAQVMDTVKTAPAEVAQSGTPVRSASFRIPLERLSGRMGEVISRLDEISQRLTAIENLLAGLQQPGRAPRKPPGAATQRKPSARQPRPRAGQPQPPAGQPQPPAAQPGPPAEEA
jgi:ATP-dependent Clp protease ATP-binding subunit ClpA